MARTTPLTWTYKNYWPHADDPAPAQQRPCHMCDHTHWEGWVTSSVHLDSRFLCRTCRDEIAAAAAGEGEE